MQEPNLKPFFVSLAKAGDASWWLTELEGGWLADDVVTLDDESFGVCWLEDDFATALDCGVLDEDSCPSISLEELSF